MPNVCRSTVEILSSEVNERPKKAGGVFKLLQCVVKIDTDDGHVIAGNIEFPLPEGMTVPQLGKYQIRYEPRRDWQDGKIKPTAVEFVPVRAGSPAPAASSASKP